MHARSLSAKSHQHGENAISRKQFLIGLAFGVIGVSTYRVRADEHGQTDKVRDEELAALRLEAMKDRIAAVTIESKEEDFPKRFSEKPIFRYTDPARGYVAATVWKLGDHGRPKAIMAVELNPASYRVPSISFEYGSISESAFTASWSKTKWSPKGTLYRFKPIPDAPAPEKTAALRLIQLRALARRFAATEVVDQQKYELRLLPQPVDRYVPSNEKNSDGAIFFFTFGTNPEVVLLIESEGQNWTYAVGRLTGAQEVIVTLDNSVAWQGAPLESGIQSPFTGHVEPIDIPGITKNGSEFGK